MTLRYDLLPLPFHCWLVDPMFDYSHGGHIALVPVPVKLLAYAGNGYFITADALHVPTYQLFETEAEAYEIVEGITFIAQQRIYEVMTQLTMFAPDPVVVYE